MSTRSDDDPGLHDRERTETVEPRHSADREATRRPRREPIAVRPARETAWPWVVGGLLLLILLLAVFLVPLFMDEGVADVEVGTTLSEINTAPNAYLGRVVTVTGEVEEILGARALIIGQEGFEFGGDQVLVIGDPGEIPIYGRPFDQTFMEGRAIRVTGMVRSFDLAELERDLGVDLDDAVFGPWAGRPVILARSIQRLTPVAGGPGAQVGAPLGGIAANQNFGLTVDQIVENPAAFLGQAVRVSGEVEEVFGPRSFALEDSDLLVDEQILVVAGRPLLDRAGRPLDINLLGDQNVRVAGTVRRFDLAAFERDLGLDLDDNLLGPLAGQPAIIARSITTVGGAALGAPVAPTAPAAGLPAAPGVAAPAQPAPVQPVPAQPLPPAPGLGQPAALTVPQILSNPNAYVGRAITIQASVVNQFSPNAFTIAGPQLGPQGGSLLVVGAGPNFPPTLAPGQSVLVTGALRPFDRTSLERQLGIRLDDNLALAWTGQPVVVAQSIQR